MDQTIIDFLQSKRIAVVGVSRDPKKFGTSIFEELKARGYTVYGVNNVAATDFDGDPCYPNLSALQGEVDGVVICIQPGGVPEVLREAAQLGLRSIWLQKGAELPEALQTAQELGLKPVVGRCILMYAGQVQGFHRFHRFFVKLAGKY